jgi:hypothetical protein
MSWAFIAEASWQFVLTLWHVLPWLVGMGVIFSVLALVSPCNPGKPWWKKRGLGTDLTRTPRYLRGSSRTMLFLS